MAIHAEKKEHLRRRRESLGHLKLHLDELSTLVDEWKQTCGSVIISVGEGVTADFVEDLVDATNVEISHLVIQTENPSLAISLRRHKAELSYFANPQDLDVIISVRASLAPYKLHTPYYRLRSFWWLVYLLFGCSIVVSVAKVNNWNTPFWPLFLPFVAIIILIFWFLYSFHRMRQRSSTRLLRGKQVSKNWRRAKSLTYWISPPIILALGIALSDHLHHS